MKRLSVAIPPKYDIALDELDAYLDTYRARIERLAYEAEQKIGEYCEIERYSIIEGIRNSKLFISTAVACLCYSDYAVFPDDWRTSNECSLLHDIAEALDIPILEVFG